MKIFVFLLILFNVFKLYSDDSSHYEIYENIFDKSYVGEFGKITKGVDCYYTVFRRNSGFEIDILKLNLKFEIEWIKSFGYYNTEKDFNLVFLEAIEEIKDELHLILKINPYFTLATYGHLTKTILNKNNGELIYQNYDTLDSNNFKSNHSNIILNNVGKYSVLNLEVDSDNKQYLFKYNFDINGRFTDKYVLQEKNDNEKYSDFILTLEDEFLFRSRKDDIHSFNFLKNDEFVSFEIEYYEHFIDKISLDQYHYVFFQESRLPLFPNELVVFRVDNNLKNKTKTKINLLNDIKINSIMTYKDKIILTGNSRTINGNSTESQIYFIVLNENLEIENYYSIPNTNFDVILGSVIDNKNLVCNCYSKINDEINYFFIKLDLDSLINQTNSVLKEINFDEFYSNNSKSNVLIYDATSKLIFNGNIRTFFFLSEMYSQTKLFVLTENGSYKIFIQ